MLAQAVPLPPPMRRLVALAILALVLSVSLGARAHTVALSHGEYRLDGTTLHAKVALRNEDLASAASRADTNGDGTLDEGEITNGTAALEDAITRRIVARAGDQPCGAGPVAIHLDGTDGVAFTVDYACPGGGEVVLDLGFLGAFPSGHRHLASITAHGETRDQLVVLAEPRVVIGPAGGRSAGFWGLVVDGLFHILTGPDHLAFLVGVLLSFAAVGGERPTLRARILPLVGMLTAFTVGHSAALAMATLGGFAPSVRFIEPGVALSVAYIGLENLGSFRLRPRALVTLVFGFVHGFAYASGLLPLGIPPERLPIAVVAFNVGVELGQLSVVVVVLPLLLVTEHRARFRLAQRIIAGALVAAGVVWFFDRVLRGG